MLPSDWSFLFQSYPYRQILPSDWFEIKTVDFNGERRRGSAPSPPRITGARTESSLVSRGRRKEGEESFCSFTSTDYRVTHGVLNKDSLIRTPYRGVDSGEMGAEVVLGLYLQCWYNPVVI